MESHSYYQGSVVMLNTAPMAVGSPEYPLDAVALSNLRQAVAGLSPDQLTWASGYLAGLSTTGSALADSECSSLTMTILYATQGGNARSVARTLASAAMEQSVTHRLIGADQYRPRDLVKEKLLIVVISTQGEGEPPESAQALFEYLQGRKSPRLNDMRYTIFGLGDSSYPYFCQAAKNLDAILQARGARRLEARFDADVDYQTHTKRWCQQLLNKVEALRPEEQVRIVPIPKRSVALRYDRSNPFQASLIEQRRITTEDALSEVYHLTLEIDSKAIQYQPGDALGVVFRNDPDLVAEILALTKLDGSDVVTLNDETMTFAQALMDRLELTQLHPKVAASWAKRSEYSKLAALVRDNNKLRDYIHQRQFIDLLRDYPAAVDVKELIALLLPSQPRLYSIASSQKAYEDEVHLTVATRTNWHKGLEQLGGASGYLTRRAVEGDAVKIYVVDNSSFKLPKQSDTPIIMVGAGTGIAPFRAFLQEREVMDKAGRNWLIFGNRHFHRDFLYQSDWLNYRKKGLLSRVSVAFSRDAQERIYVPVRLYEEGAELYRWLEEGACLYVCGKVAMAQAVHQTIQTIVAVQGGLDEEAASQYITSLRQQGRYQRDVY
jgi:sulfite reductase (NADPH) flavoprotein alpha-component